MNNYKLFIFCLCIVVCTSVIYSQINSTDLLINHLKCEYISNPSNIDIKQPHFSWIIKSNSRGYKQTAYQLVVAKDRSFKNIIYDSHKQNRSETYQIKYQGESLKSNSQYYWYVNVWDSEENLFRSDTAKFETAILNPKIWKAKWIGASSKTEYFPKHGFYKNVKEQYGLADTIVHNGRSLLLRKSFACNDNIKNARIFVTGLGIYELLINGKRIGDHYHSPAKTNYRKEILYDTYDVTMNLTKGENAIGLHLGNGWFNPYKKWWRPYRMQWFGAKRAFVQLEIEYNDGRKETIVSNKSWKKNDGPVLFNCIYDGEVYDANKEIKNWSSPDYNDSDWINVSIVKSPGGKLVSQLMPAIKKTEEFNPVVIKSTKNKIVYDMGQNFTGWAKIKISGNKGTKIKLRFAEEKNDDNTLNRSSNEHAKAEVIYILKGGNIPEIYEPKFTYMGFQYFEISSDENLPKIESVKGYAIHTNIINTGSFNCSNKIINKIHNATLWSQRSNVMGYPMDCPQRDERLGWFGDVQVTIDEAMYNFDMTQFYINWLSGIKYNQDEKSGDIPIISPRPYIWDEGVEWSSTYIILTWKLFQYTKDIRILESHYNTMNKYMEFLYSISDKLLLKKGWIGDWGSLVEGWNEGEPESIPTAFYFWNSKILVEIAKVLKKSADVMFYTNLANQIKEAYNKEYYNSVTGNYNDGSQMANAFPLYLGIVPEKEKKKVLDNLVKNIVNKSKGHLTTGVLGSKYMIDALRNEGREDIAYLLATQTGYPSWSDMVKNYNTMSEFWTLKQSHNHVMTGSIDAFFYNTLAGINYPPEISELNKIIIKPYLPQDMNYVTASIETINGTVKSSWKKENEKIYFSFTIPHNTIGEVIIPNGEPSKIFESNIEADKHKSIDLIESKNGNTIYHLLSGDYKVIVEK